MNRQDSDPQHIRASRALDRTDPVMEDTDVASIQTDLRESMASASGLSQNAHDLMHVLGFFYLQQNQPERALALLMLSARARPEDLRVMKTLAYAFLLNHQPKRALKIIERIEAQSGALPDHAPTQIVRARALLASGQGDMARQIFRRYVNSRNGSA